MVLTYNLNNLRIISKYLYILCVFGPVAVPIYPWEMRSY